MARLVSYFSLLSLLTVSSVGFVTYVQARVALKRLVFDRLNVTATLKEDALNLWVDNQREATVSIAQLPEVRTQAEILLTHQATSPEYQAARVLLSSYLTSAVTSRPELQEVFILTDTGGKVIISTNKANFGQYQVKSRYFTQGRHGTFVQNVYPSSLTGSPAMTIGTPLRGQSGQRLGVLAAHLNLERMDRIVLERTGLGMSGETYLVDRFNVFVSGERFGRAEYPRGVHTEGINQALKSIDGAGLYQNYAGVPVIGVYRWLAERELALLVEIHLSEALAPARQLAWTIFVVGLTSSGVLGVGVYLLARQIAKPILAITKTATQVAEGDLTVTAPVLTTDEIGVLAHTFNQMTRQLKISHEQLADYSYTVEQKAAQLELALTKLHSYQAQLVQSEKMSSLGQLVAGVAHEINNPVSFINGNLPHATQYTFDLLQLVSLYQQCYPQPTPAIQELTSDIELDFLVEDLPKLLESMRVGAERIREIVISLRNFSRLDEAESKWVDLHEGIENTLLILQHRLKATAGFSEITVIKEYATLPLVECYAGQLNQVLMNLLTNALDALEEARGRTADFSPTIWIHTGLVTDYFEQPCTDAIGKQVFIRIADNGVGIPEAIKEYLFNPFFTTKPVGKGTGLGLSISYQIIVEKHKGNLYCNSTSGKGTEFVIEIPQKQTD